MASDEHIEQDVSEVLQDLAKKLANAQDVGCITFLAAVAITLLEWLVFGFLGWEFLGLWGIGFAIVAFLMTVIVGGCVLDAVETRARTEAATSYKKRFPKKSAERNAADRLLSTIEQPADAVDALCTTLGITSLRQSKKEMERRKRELEMCRKARLRAQREAEQERAEMLARSVGECPDCGSVNTYDVLQKCRDEDGFIGELGAMTGLIASGAGKYRCRNCDSNW